MSLLPASQHTSISALLRGAEAWLRSEANFNDVGYSIATQSLTIGKYIGMQLAPGRPPRNFGQWYAALHWSGGSNRDKNPQSLDVYHGLMVTLTLRLNYAPKDRQAIAFTTPSAVYDFVDTWTSPNLIHGSWDLITAANQLIPGTAEWCALQPDPPAPTVNGFIETLVLVDFGPEREEGPDWIGASEVSDLYVVDLRFVEARRIQYMTWQT